MIYHPQWDEHDRPRVACPHRRGIHIGSAECKTCEHLTKWIDRKYETLIDCRAEARIAREGEGS